MMLSERTPGWAEQDLVNYLEERREVVYENLKDLNFEYRAGKYPEEDYAAQRATLENEAAEVLAEIDTLRQVQPL